MASGLHRRLKETVTYWAPVSYGRFGERTFAAPVTFNAHWEDRTDVHMSVKPGDTQRVRAHVWALTSMAADGYLFRGSSAVTDPTTLTPATGGTGAAKIQRVNNVGNINNTITLYEAILE